MSLSATNSSIIKRLLSGRNHRPLRAILKKIPAADLASLFGIFNEREQRLLVEALMAIDKATDVLVELPQVRIREVLSLLEKNKLDTLLNYCPEDHAAYLLGTLDEETQNSILTHLDTQRQRRLNQLLSYPENAAGRVMETQVFTVPSHYTSQEAIEYIRQKAQDQSLYYIYCVDQDWRLIGVLSLRALTTAPANTPLSEMAKRDLIAVSPETTHEEVARIVSHYDLVAIPVVDRDRRLLGVVTVDDVLDIIQEQATADIYASAGLQEDDRVYSPPQKSFSYRLPWILLNLVLASGVSSVVALFEETMSHLIVLATLNNIVAGIGGNTAVQTLTVVTRGLATGDFNFTSYKKAIFKEVFVGVSLGIITGICCAILVYFWKGNTLVAAVICCAMIINAFVASSLGSMIPIVLKRMKWDPAVGSGVICTAATDCFGFLSFLGIATLALKYIGEF